jgi:DNA-binding NarL/FixJ family response regulator
MRVVLCDDHRLFAEPVAAALQRRGHEAFIATTPAEAILAVGEHRPDVCVVDLRFPEGEGDGITAVADLHDRHPWCPVVVLSGSADEEDVDAAMAAGAIGFLRKDQSLTVILEALDRVVAGRGLRAPPKPRLPAGAGEGARVRRVVRQLTFREREVLRRLVLAENTEAIAQALGVAPSTVRTHLQNVLVKLGVHSRLQAVALVLRAGMDGDL